MVCISPALQWASKKRARPARTTYNLSSIYSHANTLTSSTPSTPPPLSPSPLDEAELLPMWNIRKRAIEEPDKDNSVKKKQPTQHRRPALVGGEELREREGESTIVEVWKSWGAQKLVDHLALPPDPPSELPPLLSKGRR